MPKVSSSRITFELVGGMQTSVPRLLAMKWLSVFLFAALSFAVHADQLIGRVVGVADGDTITVLDASKTQHRIRLMGIDAPEKHQPFGQASKRHLSDQVYGKEVNIEWNKRDRYGRTVGKVLQGGRDVCLEQIKSGLAWHYKKYEREQQTEDHHVYAETEVQAQHAKVGLWSEPNPVPPWEWRKR